MADGCKFVNFVQSYRTYAVDSIPQADDSGARSERQIGSLVTAALRLRRGDDTSQS